MTSGWDPSDPSSPTLSRQQNAFGSEIPPHLIHSAHLEERYLSQAMAHPPPIPHPAALPRHLEKQILNAHRHGRDRAVMDGVGDDNSVLPVPNHVVLNHLATSAIKNGVLAVATTTRYHKKVSQVTQAYRSLSYELVFSTLRRFIINRRLRLDELDAQSAHYPHMYFHPLMYPPPPPPSVWQSHSPVMLN